jgi:hypothetical protein
MWRRMVYIWLKLALGRTGAVMSDGFDRDFAGAADAKAEIRAAVRCPLSGLSGSARGDMVRDIIDMVREVVNGLPAAQSDPFDDELPGG